MRITGNKGEWSELYAFLKLLSLGKLYAADENVEIIEDIYFPIFRILRNEGRGRNVDYVVNNSSGDVTIILENETVDTISKEWIDRAAVTLFSKICAGSDRAFEIESADLSWKNCTWKNCQRLQQTRQISLCKYTTFILVLLPYAVSALNQNLVVRQPC